MKATKILWIALLSAVLFTTGCGENCNFDEQPVIEAVDCGFQEPFHKYSKWTFLDSLTGDTVVLEKDTIKTTIMAETPPCERWEEDSIIFKNNSENLFSIVFRQSDLQIQIGESPFNRSTQNIQFENCMPSEPESPAQEVVYEVSFFESLNFLSVEYKNVYLAKQIITSFSQKVTLNAWLNEGFGLIKLSRVQNQQPLTNITLLNTQ